LPGDAAALNAMVKGESADGPQLTHAAVDWIEAIANGETLAQIV
jgi:hypothetical protein